MKKLFGFLLVSLAASICHAGGRGFVTYGDFGPSFTSTFTTVTIAAPGAARTNCITELVVTSTTAYTFRMLDGGTTDYEIPMQANSGIVKDWLDTDPWCASIGNSLSFTTTVTPTAINYKGFIR